MADRIDSSLAMFFAKESASAARNRVYAQLAKKDGDNVMSNLLNALATAEEVHARRALMHLRGKTGELDEYYESLLESKREAFSTEFPEISKKFEEKGRKTPAEMFAQFGKVAENHYNLLEQTRNEGQEASRTFYVCQVCGYISTDCAPEKCPVCGAVQSRFKLEEGLR